NRTAWYGIPTAIHLHGPLVMFSHAMGWPEVDSEFFKTGTHLEATAVRLADAIVSSSQCTLGWVAEYYGRDPKNVPVLHTGIDTDRFRPLGTTKHARPTIVFAGKLAASKGVFTLLDAALELAREFPDLRLRLLGRGADNVIPTLRKRAREAGLPDLLDLAGFIDHDRLPEEFCAAHVFAAPSSYEPGPGFVNLEAMACGLPVVTTSGSGAAEIVRDGDTGLLVPPEDVPALAGALRRLLDDAGLRARLGASARAFTETEASMPKCIARFEDFYRSVVDGTHGQRRGAS
ncbi:MAG: glycosyltransferase family 4 protein, partial [Opitutaceae bacterium]